MCITNLHAHGYGFSCFPCYYLVVTMTTSLFLSLILRFNEADLIYLRSLHMQGCFTFIRLCYCTVSWMDLHIDICMYICVDEIDDVVV